MSRLYQDITIGKVIYSRVPDAFLDCEPVSAPHARGYYQALDNFMDGTDFVNVHHASCEDEDRTLL